MRRESKNWKLVKDKELFEFQKDTKSGYLTASSSAFVNCEDCSKTIFASEDWQAFLRSSVISKGFGNSGYGFRTVVEFYCQKCASEQ